MKKVALVGPEIEENLALRYMHASLVKAGFGAELFSFDTALQVEALAADIVDAKPDLVGLSMLFTSRSREFVALAYNLRKLGFRGHITAGGHFAQFHATQLLTDHLVFDSIVHGEGEEAIVDLASAADFRTVAGLSFREEGRIEFTGQRRNRPDLDGRPWPTRPERFHTYLGRPIANILSGRGCYASCHFCSIDAWHRANGGKKFRMRDVTCVAAEMGWLYHRRGVRIFNFQDDNFFLPTSAGSLRRFASLREALQEQGIGRIAIQAKARPDSITEEVVAELVKMGLFRLFLGVETDAVQGLRTLGRGIRREQNHRALEILREHGVHTCFNLLMFDPESKLQSLRENIAFMAKQDIFPLNFCRVEVYAGTPLEKRLRKEGRLLGDYMGYTYRIANPTSQLAYEIFWRVFGERNFGKAGLHHESMRVDYHLHLLRHFHPERVDNELGKAVKEQISLLNQDSSRRMGEILDFAAAGPHSEHDFLRKVRALRADCTCADQPFRAAFSRLLTTIEDRSETKRTRRSASTLSRAAAIVLAAGAWVGSPQAFAGEDDPVPVETEPRDLPPDTHMCEAAPPPHDILIELDDTHMCEAAPPPYDLIEPLPPPPAYVMHAQRVITALPKIIKLAEKYIDHSVSVDLAIDPDGVVASCAVRAHPHDERLAKKLIKEVVGAEIGEGSQGARFQVTLWNPGIGIPQ